MLINWSQLHKLHMGNQGEIGFKSPLLLLYLLERRHKKFQTEFLPYPPPPEKSMNRIERSEHCLAVRVQLFYGHRRTFIPSFVRTYNRTSYIADCSFYSRPQRTKMGRNEGCFRKLPRAEKVFNFVSMENRERDSNSIHFCN